MNYLRDVQENPKAQSAGYWKNTSDNTIISSFIDYAGNTITKKLEILLAGGFIWQVDWMSGRHYAAEDKRDTAVAHLAVARRQKKGNGTPGL